MLIDFNQRGRTIGYTFLLNAFLFVLLLSSIKCLYNSADDVFLLYIAGGGWGNTPSELLHYNYGIHPYLGNAIKWLFIKHPSINWYTLFLLAAHFFSCWVMSFQLLHKAKSLVPLAVWLSFFLLSESYFITHLTFTNTAVVLGITAFFLLFQPEVSNKRVTNIALLFIIIAALFRVHVLFLFLAVYAPFWLISKNKVHSVVTALVAIILIVVLNKTQVAYYSKNIAGWEKQEGYRGAFFDYVNQPHKKSLKNDLVEKTMLDSCFLADSCFLSEDKIRDITVASKPNNLFGEKTTKDWWFFLIDKKLPKAGGLLILLLLFFAVDKKRRIILALGSAVVVCVLFFLFVKMKVPDYIVYSLIGLLLLLAGRFTGNVINIKARQWLFSGSLIVVLSVLHLRKVAVENATNYNKWQLAYHEIAAHPHQLFIAADDNFPRDYFSIWDAPANFQLKNMLLKDHFLNGMGQSVFSKFKIHSNADIFKPGAVFFTGNKLIVLQQYLKTTGKDSVYFSPVQNFRYNKIWELKKRK